MEVGQYLSHIQKVNLGPDPGYTPGARFSKNRLSLGGRSVSHIRYAALTLRGEFRILKEFAPEVTAA